MEDTRSLVAFWFDGWSDTEPLAPNDPCMQRWWQGGPELDATIRDRFLALHLAAARPEASSGLHSDPPSAEAAVGRILLLDQVPRNAFRGTAHMFATDALARNATRAVLESELWERLPHIHRYFALMPLMHSEDLADHDLAVVCFTELRDQTVEHPRAEAFANALDYEQRHRDIIVRWGRYPHRNAALGRETTPEEEEFLRQPGSSF